MEMKLEDYIELCEADVAERKLKMNLYMVILMLLNSMKLMMLNAMKLMMKCY